MLAGATFLPAQALGPRDIVSPIADQILVLFNVLAIIVFTASVVAFGWGIISFVLGANDPARLEKTKGFLLWGVIGMAVGSTLFGIITFLQSYTGVKGGRLIITPPDVIQGGANGTIGGGTVGTGGAGGSTGQPPTPPPPPGTGTTTSITP